MALPSAATPDTLWDAHWAAAARATSGSAVRELLKLTEQPDFISFAGGLPAPESFPAEEIASATERVLATQAARVLQYGPTEGFPPLRALLADMMAARGVAVASDQVLITSGSQQALDILARLLIDPDDTIVVEDPTYMGALQAWRPYRPRFATLPIDDHGMLVERLEAVLSDLAREGRRPKFLYTVSNFQNPSGVTLSHQRREQLLDIAERHDLPIVEDDPYGALRFEGTAPPLLAALDHQRHGAPRHVLYLSTFSKLLAPGLRIGWATGPAALLQRIVHAKQGIDLHTGSLAQAIAYETARDGLLDRTLPRIRALYHQRRDVMLAALEREMPAEVRWTRPEGGMFLWLTVPAEPDGLALLRRAVAQQVSFVPGVSFFANGGGENALRLNFSYSAPDRIDAGISRLATAIRAML
ncbi:MAG TPA: PLP-dependent aminotransferase family protein [Roseiflexaceae bacterium]|nr:PLP-dependent aminotransferase family protein [Roseiflexaceae bacterium]HMP42470.1 PLP-dependent aminotransferase family protein [Roseiflexaceae bacterium]